MLRSHHLREQDVMDLSRLQQQLQQPDLAPVESWNPAFCGDLPLSIDVDGHWYYMESKITRLALVKLFASVLLCQEQQYFLQTPVEKVRIQVQDVPFIITEYQWQNGIKGPELWLTTNLGDSLPVSAANPLFLREFSGQLLPYIQLWRGLSARLHRNLYYQLLQEASMEEQVMGDLTYFRSTLQSAAMSFTLAEETE